MDALFGILVFAVLAVVSIVKKAAEQKQIEEAKKQRQAGKTSIEDLPEETRRMIYGDGAPPVATPKGPAPRQARPAQPRPVPARPVQPQRPVPQRRPGPAGAGRTPDMRAPRSLAEQPERRPGPPVARETQRRPPQQRPQPQRMPQQAARRRPPERPPEVAREAAEPAHQAPPMKQKRTRAERPAEPQAHARQAPMAPAAVMARRMFANSQSLRHAIIAMEVLGPPKGMQY